MVTFHINPQSKWLLCRIAGLLLGVTLTAGLNGCGRGDGLARREVHGSVTFDNQIVERGAITLFPKDGGPVASTKIQNGQFHIDKNQGPIPGEYRVEITGLKETGKVLTIQEPGSDPIERPEIVSFIPNIYNSQSELTLTIPADQKVIKSAFKLEKPLASTRKSKSR